MGVSVFLSFAQPNAIDDAGVVELVTKHGILWCESNLKQPGVGVKATGIQNGVLSIVELSDFFLQLQVDILGERERGAGDGGREGEGEGGVKGNAMIRSCD